MRTKALFFSLAALFLFIFLTPAITHAAEATCFSSTFTRGTATPAPVISGPFPGAFSGPALVRLWNGAQVGATVDQKVSSSEISVNGALVFGPSNFNQNVSYLEAAVNLNESNNTCEVLLKSKPGGQITIEIVQQVDAAAAAFIGPQGGVVEVTDPTSALLGVIIEIPAGAIASPQLISIHEPTTPPPIPAGFSGDYPMEIFPSGLTFSVPVTLSVPSNGASERLFYFYDEAEQVWWVLPTVLNEDLARFEVTLEHLTMVIALCGFQWNMDCQNFPVCTTIKYGIRTNAINIPEGTTEEQIKDAI